MSKRVGIHASLGTRSRDIRTVVVLKIIGWVLVSGGIIGSFYALYAIHPALLGLVCCPALIIAGMSLADVEHIEDYDDEGKHKPHARVAIQETPREEGK